MGGVICISDVGAPRGRLVSAMPSFYSVESRSTGMKLGKKGVGMTGRIQTLPLQDSSTDFLMGSELNEIQCSIY